MVVVVVMVMVVAIVALRFLLSPPFMLPLYSLCSNFDSDSARIKIRVVYFLLS